MFKALLFNREKALAFEWEDCGEIDQEIVLLQKIRIVLYSAFQNPGISILYTLRIKAMKMLKECLYNAVIEESYIAYRNKWFLVVKKDGNFWLINDA